MLCAQHALNSLLQSAYWTVFDLAEIARGLDEQERLRLAEGGADVVVVPVGWSGLELT